ncbi:PEP-CTERM sorting domain-containing protein [Schlegelella sp. S2-27]|uniref:PEP-CTERM sorting domain-containing protein n=1 Tax=Caldimonas mangrovi TaxID=2944811 RepID=A0ABT0YVU6_9BURK|nr:PEP-CTERM sorting domain-containing protein [Caldimonas mangrovi]MCM5682867.1 PEP-CTERM sorting domain-containing protein [Caldimonas mangrovi]
MPPVATADPPPAYIAPGETWVDDVPVGWSYSDEYIDFVNEGRYVKTGDGGRGYTWAWGFDNRGEYDVTAGAVSFGLGAASNGWRNSGQLYVREGAQMEVFMPRFNATSVHSGHVHVERNAVFGLGMALSSVLESSGAWTVDRGGHLAFSGASGPDPWGGSSPGDSFTGVGIRNEGVVSFSGNYARFSGGATLSGSGRVELVDGAVLDLLDDLRIGSLLVDQPVPSDVLPTFSLLRARHVTLDALEWGSGKLEVSSVTVHGATRLYGYTYHEYQDGQSSSFVREKRVENPFVFQGDVDWAGDYALVGGGRITVDTAGRFLDNHDHRDPWTGVRMPQYIDIARFDNHGTYLKTGAGDTTVLAPFVNTGLVTNRGAGTLTLAGAVDNRGTLEADGARLVVHGALQQLQLDQATYPRSHMLTGGRYVMRNGVIVLTPRAADAPRLADAKIRTNGGHIVLDGPGAGLRVAHLGSDYEALDELIWNKGSLVLLNGAQLGTGMPFYNAGALSVGAGSLLDVADRYTNDGGAAWIGGRLDAESFSFFSGTLGAGLEGEVGDGVLSGGALALGGTGMLHLDLLGSEHFDTLSLADAAMLGGQLWAEFGPGAAPLGSFRFLTADGGVSGRFASIASNLDPSRYVLSAVYGATYVELNVAAVPEPETYLLMAIGLGLLGYVGRRRRPGAARPGD